MKRFFLGLLCLSSSVVFADYDCLYCESEASSRLPCQSGEWLPERPPLFRPFVADPREVDYSVGWRMNDEVLARNVADVSFGDTIAFYRWYDIAIGPVCGDLELDMEGAVWAVFDPLHESSPLINADYYVGIPVTFKSGPLAFRLRFFHISSHIGDEFLLNNPGFDRRNPSAEYIDLFCSYYWTPAMRIYAGVGVIAHQDLSFEMGPLYSEMGMEMRFPFWSFYSNCQKLFGEPYFAMHFRFNRDFDQHLDQTYALGYEIGKTNGLCRRVRVYMEYHDGYSLEGQFSRLPTNYFSLRLSYGY